MSKEFVYTIGYFLGIVVAGIPIKLVLDNLWHSIVCTYLGNTINQERKIDSWLPAIVGGIDRALYMSSILMGKEEFIAVWLTLKTIAQPSNWTKHTDGVPGRAVFNIFIIGNGLCILFAASSAYLIKWVLATNPNRILLILLVNGLLYFASFGIYAWLENKNFDWVKRIRDDGEVAEATILQISETLFSEKPIRLWQSIPVNIKANEESSFDANMYIELSNLIELKQKKIKKIKVKYDKENKKVIFFSLMKGKKPK